MTRTLSLALAIFCGSLSLALAAERPLQAPKGAAALTVNCTFTSAFNSRPLFLNAGIYASKTPAQTSDVTCFFQEGLYVNVWNLTPFSSNFGDGGEVDVRGGWTKKFGSWGIDVSAAWYNYRIDGLGVLNSANVRGRVFYDFLPATSAAILQAYGLIDYQHSFDFKPAEALAIVGGAYAGYWFTPKLKMGVAAEVWQYATHFAPNRQATIYSVIPQADYKLTDTVTLFGRLGLASGSAAVPGDHGLKHSTTVGAAFKF